MNRANFLFLLLAVLCGCGKHVASVVYHDESYIDTNIRFVLIDSTIQNSAYLDSVIMEYKSVMDESMNEVAGYSARPLTKAQPESTLGYLAVDALYEYAYNQDSMVRGAVMNYGGMRINYLSPGPVTIGNVYEIMPFDNMVVVLYVSGAVVKKWCNHMAERGGWPVYGISYEIKDRAAENVRIDNKPVNDHIVYRIATTDYIANGGDDCEFLKGLKRVSYNKFHRDTMIDFLRRMTANNDTLNYQLENRILYNE